MDVKPKSRRGRKPKIKDNIDDEIESDVIIRKKRGRKKKCEMNIDLDNKISGYIPNVDSIDTRDNKVTFTSDSVSEKISDDRECETVTFGLMKIKRRTVTKIEEKVIPSNFMANDKCLINFDWIVDNTEKKKENPQQNIKQTGENSLSLFFCDNPPKKRIITFDNPKIKKTKKEIPNVNYVKIMHHIGNKTTELPSKTDILCWWCCHKFESIPRYLPTHYDEKRKRFRITGNFCSWECVKAFQISDSTYTSGNNMSILSTLIRSIHGRTYQISAAPPRSALSVFGGKMNIEEFRNLLMYITK